MGARPVEADLPRVIMKFGGSSLATARAMGRAAGWVLRERRAPLVVVSAVGGVTDLLLRAAGQALAGEETGGLQDEIFARHRAITEDLGLDPMLLRDLEERLLKLLQGISLLRELTPRIQDAVVALGEQMSARLMAGTLGQRGRPARAWLADELGLLTDDNHGCAEPLPGVLDAMGKALSGLDRGEVPVVTGFIARSAAGERTTLGRGGSDFSAALFGAAAGVEEIQIWTDVPGILRADPRVVPRAGVISALTFEEAAELAFFGAKVLHPRTIEPARRGGVPVRVLGTFTEEPPPGETLGGTLIVDQAPVEPVRALALHEGVNSLHVHSLRMLDAPGFLAKVFEVLSRHHLSVDVVATSEVSISMTLDRGAANLAPALAELACFAEVEQIAERSILCLVGTGLRDDSALLARVFAALAARGLPVDLVSQGASRINVTLVTGVAQAREAMGALYQELFADG